MSMPLTRIGFDVNVTGFQYVKSDNLVIGITPTLLSVGLAGRQAIGLYNVGSGTGNPIIYIGDATVTISTGLPIPYGAYYFADASDFLALYGIRDIGVLGQGNLRIIEYA